jgi:DNA-binding CsgD family transcriptional regulator/tetratricopeptide (TPR) repeat protein
VTLRGRRRECGLLNALLEAVSAGQSRVLVVRGETGVGKSALLEYVRGRASGCRVLRASGVQSEMELAFAGLQQLCAPMLDRLDRLPEAQREGLQTAFALSTGVPPDRFILGLAVLSLLADAAEEQPVVCLVDDVQWLDTASAETLAFVARRLLAESVALVLAVREPTEELAGLPELEVGGLDGGDARALLGSALRGPLDERVRDRIVAETRGNPLALLELPRGLTLAEMAGGFGLLDAPGLSGRIEESFQRRLESLPAGTQRLLLVAAAEPVGDPALVWRAAEPLGIGLDAAEPAAESDLVDFGARVRFRHPLVRSAVYHAASPDERRRAHEALAEATDPEVDPDRRAWHRAQATTGLDETVAAELERSAGRAQARGGLAAAAAFLERATELTPEPARRAQRALAAAETQHQAGAYGAALALLATAEAGELDELGCARVDLLRGQIAFAVSRGSDAPPLLLKAAKRFEPVDMTLARETYLDALAAALFAGRLATGRGALEIAQAARATPRRPGPTRATDLLLDGWTLMIMEGYAAATPVLKRALSGFLSQEISREEETRWLWLACHAAFETWDEAWAVLSNRHVEVARESGALTVLPIALQSPAVADLLAGDFATAASLLEEAAAISEAIGTELPPYGPVLLAAYRGREADAVPLIEANVKDAVARGEGIGLAVIQWASALLYNGLGRYEDALVAAEQATEHPRDPPRTLPELVEAAVRRGRIETARAALARLSETTQPSGSDWGLGMEALSRALISENESAERLYREAIHRLGRTSIRLALARAHLLYGEWLRRERRLTDAREQLRTAHEMFTTIGAEAFAERAGRELRATGGTARKRTVEPRYELTAQEGQIARLAGQGLSNAEIAARLFISPRTVEYHLHKVFGKLDIASRNELRRVLASEGDVAQPV